MRNHWPAITITVTAAVIVCAAIVMLRGMPPQTIVMPDLNSALEKVE